MFLKRSSQTDATEQPELVLVWGTQIWRALRPALIAVAVWVAHCIYPVLNFSLPIDVLIE